MHALARTSVVALAAFAFTAPVALADNPSPAKPAASAVVTGPAAAAVQADIAALQAAVSSKHDLVIADANKLAADASALTGSTHKDAARGTLALDRQKLLDDLTASRWQISAIRQTLKADLAAARQAKEARGLLPLLKSARDADRAAVEEIRAAEKTARQAVAALRGSWPHSDASAIAKP